MLFNFDVVLKQNKTTNKKPKTNIYKIISKSVYCICGITMEGSYYAINIKTNEKFNFTSRSFSLKTNNFYAQQIINNKRVNIIQLHPKNKFPAPWLYNVVAPGIGLYGNIVKSELTNNIMFDLSETFIMPKNNTLSRDMFLFYRENYNEIYNNILNKYGVK